MGQLEPSLNPVKEKEIKQDANFILNEQINTTGNYV